MNENNVVVQTLEQVYEQQRLQKLTPSRISQEPIKVLIISQTTEITKMIQRLFNNEVVWKFRQNDIINHISINRNVKKFDLSNGVRNNQVNPIEIFDSTTELIRDEGSHIVLKQIQNYGEQDLVIFAIEDTNNFRKGEHYIIQLLKNLLINKGKYRQIFQADIQSLEFKDIQNSFKKLKKVDIVNGFNSVIREICDLKIGLSFTRFFTQSIVGNINRINNITFSFGPCQSPILHYINEEENKRLQDTKNLYKIILQLDSVRLYIVNDSNLSRFNSLQAAKNFVSQIKRVELIRIEQQRNDNVISQCLNNQSLLELGQQFGYSVVQMQRINRDLYEQGFITQPNVENVCFNKGNRYYKNLISKIENLRGNNNDWTEIITIIDQNRDAIDNLNVQRDRNSTASEAISPTFYIPDLERLTERSAQIYMQILKKFLHSLLLLNEESLYQYTFKYNDILFQTQWIQNVPQITINTNKQQTFNVIRKKALEGHKGFYEIDLIDKIKGELGGNQQFARTHIINIYNRGYVRIFGNIIYTTSLGEAYNDILKKFVQRFIKKESRKNLLEKYDKYSTQVDQYYDTITIQQQQDLLNEIINDICQPYKNHLTTMQGQEVQIKQEFNKIVDNLGQLILQDSEELIKCPTCNKDMQYNQIFDIIQCKICKKKQKTGIKNLLLKDPNNMTCLKCKSQLCLIEIPLKMTNHKIQNQKQRSIEHGYVQVCTGCNLKDNIMDTCQDYILKKCKDCNNEKQLIVYCQDSQSNKITLFKGCMKCKRLFIIEQSLLDFSLTDKKCKKCKDNNMYKLKFNDNETTNCLSCKTTKNQFFGKMFLKFFEK